ncbi:MAG TPA: penicillin-binding transpeptidase domain-containing protein, partial [Pyrinomonadaceae bacterium]
YNFHAVAAAESAGLSQAVDFLGDLTNSHPGLTGMAAVGGTAGSETTLLDLTRAYSIFPNNGRLVQVRFQQSFAQGGLKKELKMIQPEAVAEGGAAFVVTQMLRSVIGREGTSPAFLKQSGVSVNSSIAAKSGTGMVADVWFIVFTSRLIVGVWGGLPQNDVLLRLSDGFSGASVAAPIAAKFIHRVREFRPELLSGQFEQPANVIRQRINSRRSCADPNGDLDEFFIRGRELRSCSGLNASQN